MQQNNGSSASSSSGIIETSSAFENDDLQVSEEQLQETLKRSAIASVHRDKSLSSIEKQQRIQAILRGADFAPAKRKIAEEGEEEGKVGEEEGEEGWEQGKSGEKRGKIDENHCPTAVSFYSGRDALLPTLFASRVNKGEGGARKGGAEERVFGCAHFKRDLYLLAPCCNKWYVCRVCHDEQEDHLMDRINIKQQCCMFCLQVTPVGQCCTSSVCINRPLAQYYCGKCFTHRKETDLLFWHCDKCGICRVGAQKSVYEHCDQCNLCYVVDPSAKHRCLQSSSASQSCPICSQNIHSSQRPIVAMRCGHGIHIECMQSMCAQREIRSMRCPLCKQSFEDMRYVWVEIDSAISASTMPEPERHWTAHIGCNDCHTHTERAAYHYYGLKCGNEGCGSYNTYLVELHKVGTENSNDAGSSNVVVQNDSLTAASASFSSSTAAAASSSSATFTNSMQEEEKEEEEEEKVGEEGEEMNE